MVAWWQSSLIVWMGLDWLRLYEIRRIACLNAWCFERDMEETGDDNSGEWDCGWGCDGNHDVCSDRQMLKMQAISISCKRSSFLETEGGHRRIKVDLRALFGEGITWGWEKTI